MTLRIVGLGVAMVPWLGAHADPWLAPGDLGLRSDIQLLADAGILRGPTTTWPMSWPDVARDALAAEDDGLDETTSAALVRIRRLARAASSHGYSGAGARVAGGYEPVQLRTFAETPREEGEVMLKASWLTEHVAVNLQATYAAGAEDGKRLRPDGSYLGVNIGNFMISAGYMDRWWGPGWDGSLILSTNARPMPTLTLERNYTDAYKSRWLSWLGPWRASIALGEAEESDIAVPNVRFLAARVAFKPRPWLEFGLSRTAQWCGGDRPCGWGILKDLLLGRDNRETAEIPEDEPGNQMAGYDARLRSPWRKLPLALYGQLIGEDEANGLPSKFLGLAGLELWGSSPIGGLRLRAEYADTTCTFSRENPQFDCAYRNLIYPQGYSYRGRPLGHAMDNDSRMSTVAAVLVRPNGDVASLEIRHVELNRDGAGEHAISPVSGDLYNVELRYSRISGFGKVSFGVGHNDGGVSSAGEGVHGHLSWQQGF